jgi:hypothetical protein
MEAKQPLVPSRTQPFRPSAAARIADVDRFGAADPPVVAQPCLYHKLIQNPSR